MIHEKGASAKTLDAADRLQLGELEVAEGESLPDRDRVEPYLAALLQTEHLNLLIGAGLTNALAYAAGFKDGPDMTAALPLADSGLKDRIEAQATETAENTERGDQPNIEDRLRVAMAAAEGLRIAGDDRWETLDLAIRDALGSLRQSIFATESALLVEAGEAVASNATLQGLLMTFLGSFAGRAPTRDRLHVFTTNYDRVIEWGAELSGLRIVDRFVGTLEPVFRSSRLELDYHYSPPGSVRDPRHLDGVFRLTKLHGSVDWKWQRDRRRVVRSPLPFGSGSEAPEPDDLMIFPNSAKDMETTFYPYADLFRDFSAALCRPHTALITYGYSFGDDHVNRVIRDMLTIPSTHLLIISYDDARGRIANFIKDHGRLGQISLMLGPTFAGLPELVGQWLPRPSAEFLLQRRAQIYRNRQTGHSSEEPDGEIESGGEVTVDG